LIHQRGWDIRALITNLKFQEGIARRGHFALPLNSQDIGTSRWQLGDKSTSAPST
jgi:hypothetical protein